MPGHKTEPSRRNAEEKAVQPIEVSYHDTDIAIVSLYGEHDLAANGQLVRTLRSLVRSGDQVIVDLSEVEFIDSSVLNNLVMTDRLARQRGSTLTLQVATAAIVHTALEVTGMLKLLACASTREEAISVARNGSRRDEASQVI
jgi:anti-anti-sigma factor